LLLDFNATRAARRPLVIRGILFDDTRFAD
jgi:hypothetical protein